MHKSTPKCSPGTPRPADPTARSHPKVTARGHTCRPPEAAPASLQGRWGTRLRVSTAATPCALSANPGQPPVSSAGPQSALGPQCARRASHALLVLTRAFPKSPHPLDISANQSTWRSARRRPPALQSAPQVPRLRQDSASESGTFLFFRGCCKLKWVGRRRRGRETGGGDWNCCQTAALLWRPASHQQILQPLTRVPMDCEDQAAGDLGCCPLPAMRALTLNSLPQNDSRRLSLSTPTKLQGLIVPGMNAWLDVVLTPTPRRRLWGT